MHFIYETISLIPEKRDMYKSMYSFYRARVSYILRGRIRELCHMRHRDAGTSDVATRLWRAGRRRRRRSVITIVVIVSRCYSTIKHAAIRIFIVLNATLFGHHVTRCILDAEYRIIDTKAQELYGFLG